jgi:hypothetical protein
VAEGHEGNPYVGPRPFDRQDVGLFFGRDREMREVVSLVVADRLLLLYSASGAGKTSLLNAGVIPLLEDEEQFDVLPPARVRDLGVGNGSTAGSANIYAHGVVSQWARELGDESREDGDVTLAQFLAGRERARDQDGLEKPRALVFDQFEELFTVAPEHWKQREPFLAQVAEALADDPLLRVVIAMREDYVAQLESLARILPGTLRNRFRLDRLGRESALRAVTAPLATTDRVWAPGVPEALVDDLLIFHVDTGADEPLRIAGEFVEPVQLQVACHSLWLQLPAGVREITRDHLVRFGDVDEVLGRYYDGAVRAAATAARKREARVRRVVEDAFITSVGTRGTVYRAARSTGDVPNAAVDELESRHVVRAEIRAGARWYELTHDRLIEPIQAANRSYRDARRRRRVLWGVAVLAAAVAAALFVLWNARSERIEAERRAAALALAVPNFKPLLLGHEDVVLRAVFSPGGERILTVSYDGTARLWRADRTRSLAVLNRTGGTSGTELMWAAFNGDGTRVGIAGDNGLAEVWDVATRRRVVSLRGHTARVGTIAFDPAGRVLTASDDGTVRLWRPTGGLIRVLRPGDAMPWTARFDAAGKRIVTGGTDGVVRLWDADSGRSLGELPKRAGDVQMAVFSPDGNRIAAAYGLDNPELPAVAVIWDVADQDVETPRPIVLSGHGGSVYTIAFDPAGERVVTSSEDGTALVWDVDDGRIRSILRGHHEAVADASFSPDGKLVATAGADGTVRLWNWASAEHAPRRPGSVEK